MRQKGKASTDHLEIPVFIPGWKKKLNTSCVVQQLFLFFVGAQRFGLMMLMMRLCVNE
jgi:hypothetical protein